MSDETALLAAIRANPDEDTPRLVYADWLQEHSQPERAEFIRLQCAAARLPEGDVERVKKEKASNRLFKAHKVEWFGPVWKKFNSIKPAVSHCHIERGFISSLKGDVREFIALANEIPKYAPCLRRAVVKHVRDDADKLLAKAFVRNVADLQLTTLHPNSFSVLKEHAGWGPFDALRLTFEFHNETDTLDGLADAPLVRAARRFDLYYGYFLHPEEEPEVGDAAAQEPSLRELHRLKIPNLRGFGIHGIDANSAKAVTEWPGFKLLDWLDFETCNLEDAAAVALLTASTLSKLTRLNLNENDLSLATAKALAECQQLSGLTHLAIDWNSFRDDSANCLVKSTTLPAVLPMDVSYNNFTERGVTRLRERFGPGVVSVRQF
jgi:uncharacterized protein (TIGR02996 family)